MSLNCEIQRLKTLLDYKDEELKTLKKKEDFGFECINGLREEFDQWLKNLVSENETMSTEL